MEVACGWGLVQNWDLGPPSRPLHHRPDPQAALKTQELLKRHSEGPLIVDTVPTESLSVSSEAGKPYGRWWGSGDPRGHS